MDFGIKNFAITPPSLGRISIGKVVERNGKHVPQKDDAFTITSQVQKKGEWVLHPLHNDLVDKEKEKKGADAANVKLRSIPVTLMFDDPTLNMRAEFTAFDRTTGRPMCMGDGVTARRIDQATGKASEVECPGAGRCEYGHKLCKPYGRLSVQIDGQGDELATFVFRTTGFNSIRTLQARLTYLHALTGGKVAGMPLELVLRGKSTTQSYREAIYYVDLAVRHDMSLLDAVQVAHKKHEEWEKMGMMRQFFEEAARQGLQNGGFDESEEDIESILTEFYNEEAEGEDVPHSKGGSLAALHAVEKPGEQVSPDARLPVADDDLFAPVDSSAPAALAA